MRFEEGFSSCTGWKTTVGISCSRAREQANKQEPAGGGTVCMRALLQTAADRGGSLPDQARASLTRVVVIWCQMLVSGPAPLTVALIWLVDLSITPLPDCPGAVSQAVVRVRESEESESVREQLAVHCVRGEGRGKEKVDVPVERAQLERLIGGGMST
jgi:hypothetical protein